MKWVYVNLLAIFLLPFFSVHAQNTSGTDFWLTFGENALLTADGSGNINPLNLQIRIASRELPTTVTLRFTNLSGPSATVSFNLAEWKVYTYNLTYEQKQAVYNIHEGKSRGSIHITSTYLIAVYAMNQYQKSTDATNLLPLSVLGKEYFHMSYIPRRDAVKAKDAYAVIATENGTIVEHNGTLLDTLNIGEVYYKFSDTDMTGARISANKPIAFFALNQNALIPYVGNGLTGDCLMQQLAPTLTWGNEFFVPVSSLTSNTKDRVRIVASQDNTKVTQAGGTVQTVPGGQTNLNNLMAGQFVELEILLNDNGCFIQADKPIGVCAYLTSANYNGLNVSDPSQSWVPSIEQTSSNALIVPFIPPSGSSSNLNSHYALVITPTATKDETRVTIGASETQVPLSGGTWRDHPTAGMSFYSYPLLKSASTTYYLTNDHGLIVMGYGTGNRESYYYLAYSAMKNLIAGFYANEIFYQNLTEKILCTENIDFRVDIVGMSSEPGSLKWFIDDEEVISARDQITWSGTFPLGEYVIKMWACSLDGDAITLDAPLNIGVPVTTTVSPDGAGRVIGDDCYLVGKPANVKAIANEGYNFKNWTEAENTVSTEASYTFTVVGAYSVVANFELNKYNITVLENNPDWGMATGSVDSIFHGTSVTVKATPNAYYKFTNWTKNGVEVSTDTSYTFIATESCILVANFTPETYIITTSANLTIYGTTIGGGEDIPHGTSVTVEATPHTHSYFVNWTEDDVVVSIDPVFTFTAVKSCHLVAHFAGSIYTINVEVNNSDFGYATKTGDYEALSEVRAEAILDSCYRFINWTIDGVEVSVENPYIFSAENNLNLVANLFAIDFDTYTKILWDNTFILNLNKLMEDGYELAGCMWYRNGIEEHKSSTINDYSYSAGPNKTDLLDLSPTYYMFELITKNEGNFCSSKKILTEYIYGGASKLVAYPNPVLSGTLFTIAGVVKDEQVQIYNQYGICVYNAVAADNSMRISLQLPVGIYLIRANNKNVKILVVN